MSGKSPVTITQSTRPRFAREASDIALQMTQYPVEELAKLLKLNPKLSAENYKRFQDFHSDDAASLQAILAYTGVVYKYLRPADFNAEDFSYAQDHLRIASVCYGLLRPLDKIKPYRMEYDVKLAELGEGNMYAFWRPRQTDTFIHDIKAGNGILINLASQEIQPAFDWKKVEQKVRVITPEFKVWKNGKYQTIVIYTKMARGAMTRYVIKNRLTDPEDLKAFTWEGFAYNENLSDRNNWIFTQD